MTEALSVLEGLDRGPAGNTSLTAAFSMAQEMDEDQTIVVQETEYTGAGKHVTAQLTFARENGIEIRRGNPKDQIPGKNIIIPENPGLIRAKEIDLDDLKKSYLRNALKSGSQKRRASDLSPGDIRFLCEELNASPEDIRQWTESL